jgi:hypothetical protein
MYWWKKEAVKNIYRVWQAINYSTEGVFWFHHALLTVDCMHALLTADCKAKNPDFPKDKYGYSRLIKLICFYLCFIFNKYRFSNELFAKMDLQ